MDEIDAARAELNAARTAELDAEAHRNVVVSRGGTLAERAAADASAREAGVRYDRAVAAYQDKR